MMGINPVTAYNPALPQQMAMAQPQLQQQASASSQFLLLLPRSTHQVMMWDLSKILILRLSKLKVLLELQVPQQLHRLEHLQVL
jgi:hypothetical protein